MKSKAEILEILSAYKLQYAEKYGIEVLCLFGSFARRQQREASDIDAFVKLRQADYFVMMAIQEELEKQTKIRVDIPSRKNNRLSLVNFG